LGIVAAVGIAFSLGWYAGSKATNRKAYAAVWDAISTLPEPERCALCSEGMRYHAPCLINLATGQMGELRVYTPHPSRQGEIAPAEKQQTGTFSFLPCAGLTAISDTCDHTCHVTLPEELELMNPALFCMECRQLLAGAGLEGYVIVDLYDPATIQAYPIREDKECFIRDYRVSVTSRKGASADLCVTGLLTT